MTKLRLLFLLTLLTSTFGSTNAEEKTGVYGEIKERKVKAEDGSEETLKKLLKVEGVDTQYQACKTANPTSVEKIPDCIWNGNRGSIPELSPDIRKKVQAMYDQESKSDNSGRTPASSETSSSNLTNKSKQIGEDYMSDPRVVELSKVMQKKLEEALLGTKEEQKDTKKVVSVNHANFVELYQTELGKTVVSAFTSYCIEADFDQKAVASAAAKKICKNQDNEVIPCILTILSSEQEKKEKIAKNIQSLKIADLSSSTKGKQNEDSSKWTNCIASVGNVCYTKKEHFQGVVITNSKISKQIDRSKDRACLIMDYVKSARKNLMIASEQGDFYNLLDKDKNNSLDIGNSRVVAATESNSMDAVATVTSKDIEGAKDAESSYQKKNDDLKKEMDKCMDENENIISPDACKKFLSTKTTSKEESLTEFGLRQYALEGKIEDKFKNDQEVKKYLKEEGYKEDKINEMVSNPTDLEKVKQEIIDRYKSERQALIASMAEKIKSQTSTKDGKIDSTAGGSDHDKLKKIREELSSRSEDLKHLVHFNNVVSSYLEIGKEKSRNVASLFAEIKGGAESIDKEQIKQLEKNASDAGLKAKNDNSRTILDVETINNIMKYTTEK